MGQFYFKFESVLSQNWVSIESLYGIKRAKSFTVRVRALSLYTDYAKQLNHMTNTVRSILNFFEKENELENNKLN